MRRTLVLSGPLDFHARASKDLARYRRESTKSTGIICAVVPLFELPVTFMFTRGQSNVNESFKVVAILCQH